MNRHLAIPAFALAVLAAPAAAQERPAQTDAIIVSAQRSGAPMWTIDTPRGAVILVGEIAAVPETTPWQPARLEEATRESDRVILGQRAGVSPGDILRLIFAGGRITRLPDDRVANDYLDPGQQARLAALEEAHDQDYARKSFLLTAFDLLSRRLGFNRDTTRDASDVVRRAARRADIAATPVGTVRGEDMLDSLAAADPRSQVGCLEAAMTATEIGPELIEQRGADWRAYDVPAVMANPLEIALGQCWPWADEAIGPALRGQWFDAIENATRTDGVTMAVVPLRLLAEDDGVLDRLAESGFDPAGPAWR
ncbi:TraB/GumN family protein [Erythrobacter arachoides]|uniref:TraB/GumN family protein n=1 Tax=Aurantiacibacter arachoides TaxID=1850444 RepID=A0A844ZW10_9SPHN|nr:TraB/GumN family protein [Aurantiacibacter arachoides]MXO92075.1 TraB/GumN family protein [Aurantiacibacter arachoides]GGD59979.1 TraB/GumN family protein [Aurantiacibacter arachoides]